MADPFDALRAPITPIAPDPGFARQLRARVVRALGLDEGTATVSAAAPRLGLAIPYLAVADARAAIDWYVEVFGAEVTHEPIVMPDDRIGHAELAIRGGSLYLADPYPEIGAVPPEPARASVALAIDVPDVDATVAAAVAAGADLVQPIYEDHGHRGATVVDPFGHRWMVRTPLPDPEPVAVAGEDEPTRQGDIVYASLQVPDAEQATAFFGAVLGWESSLADSGHARQVAGAVPAHGIFGGQPHPTLYLCYAVDDLDAAMARVRAAGGTVADEIVDHGGPTVECVDDQGVAFALFEIPPGAPGSGPRPVNALRHGDLDYASTQTVDSARFRAFYGAVLGWTFEGGSVEDGWQVNEPAPMVGVQGGHERPVVHPVYRVDDIEAAVERVRGAGGSPGSIEDRPYGRIAECTDDQGTVFYLNSH